MRKIIIVLLSLISISSIFAQNDKRLKGLEKELNEILEATKATGFAVAIVEGDSIIYANGFGYSDYENKIPADANTLFAIGSCSKAFTSAILGQLRDEDKLAFDDSPIEYIPELEFYNDEMNNSIIIKDLMTHRTGLPRHDVSWYLFPSYNKDSLLQRVTHQEPFTGVRQQWYYNNFMFLAQGVIAEHITGKSWEDNIKERFFEPLGMTRSNVNIEELENSTNKAAGYELKNDSIVTKMEYYHIAGMSPAGSINSSVNDMAKWLILWINKGRYNNQDIIPKTYIEEAIGSQMIVSGALPDAEFPEIHLANYGYAWFISSYKGHYRVGHGGNIDGFAAKVVFFPIDSVGIVVLANQDRSSVPGLVSNTIADRMLKLDKTKWVKKYNDQQNEAKKDKQESKAESKYTTVENTKPSHALIAYEGTYSNPGYGAFEIKSEKDSLFANFKLKRFYLRHVHYDIFVPYEITKTGIDTTDSDPKRINFNTNEAGDISCVKMQFEPTLDPIEFKRTPNAIDVDLETLESYVGTFDLTGTPIKIYIKNDNILYLFVEGQPEYELIATSKHKFSFKALEGFKVEFVESDDESINELILIQPHGTYKAIKNNPEQK